MLAGEEKLFLSCTSLKVSKATLEKTSGKKELMMDLDWSLNFPKNIFKQKSTLPLLSSLLIRAVGAYKSSSSSSLSSVLQRDHSGPPPSFSNPPSLQASLLLQTYPTFDTQNFSSHFPLNFFLNVRTSFGQFYSLSDVFFSHSLKNAYFWSVEQV